MNKYYIVTTVSQFRNRYVIPVEDMQAENPEKPVTKEWAEDAVTCEEVNDFSQTHIGEVIIDSQEIDEDEMLRIFDEENEYLSSWSTDQKLTHVRNWKYE